MNTKIDINLDYSEITKFLAIIRKLQEEVNCLNNQSRRYGNGKSLKFVLSITR